MRERRRHPRRCTRFPAVVLDGQTDRFVGYVGNITPNGIMIVSDNPIDIGREYDFKIDLPDEILGRTQFLFNACSLWCQATAESCTYSSGFELHRLSPEDVDLIRQIIEDEVFLRLIS
jgi:hypothetical protein